MISIVPEGSPLPLYVVFHTDDVRETVRAFLWTDRIIATRFAG